MLGVRPEDAVGRPGRGAGAARPGRPRLGRHNRALRRAGRPAPASPSSRGCCPTATRCWSPRGSTARPLRPRSTEVAVSLRSGRGRARLDRERSDLVATVAHELRSPLTGVKGFVQALLNRWDRLNDEQKKLMLTTVARRLRPAEPADRRAARRRPASTPAGSRSTRGRATPGRSSTRVVDSVRAGTAAPSSSRRADDLPEVSADPDKFTQVVTNLVENGVRHGDGTVHGHRPRPAASSDAAGVRIVVDDEGDGIPPEMRRRVFTKFWTDGDRGGSGLGLYLVNGLVRAHGGTVTIDDAPAAAPGSCWSGRARTAGHRCSVHTGGDGSAGDFPSSAVWPLHGGVSRDPGSRLAGRGWLRLMAATGRGLPRVAVASGLSVKTPTIWSQTACFRPEIMRFVTDRRPLFSAGAGAGAGAGAASREAARYPRRTSPRSCPFRSHFRPVGCLRGLEARRRGASQLDHRRTPPQRSWSVHWGVAERAVPPHTTRSRAVLRTS